MESFKMQLLKMERLNREEAYPLVLKMENNLISAQFGYWRLVSEAEDFGILIIASHWGQYEFLEKILPKIPYRDSDQPIIEACWNGHLKSVRLLIENGFSFRDHDDLALREAVHFGHSELVGFLLESGANVHTRVDQCLISGVENNDLEMVKILLAFGADVGARNREAPLIAQNRGWIEMVHLLITNSED